MDRFEQLVFARIAQLEKLLHRVADADLLQPDKHADAVVDVHDEVGDFEIAKIGQKCLGGGATAFGSTTFFLEDISFGEELERRVGQSKAARETADGDKHRRVSRIVLQRHQRDTPRQRARR